MSYQDFPTVKDVVDSLQEKAGYSGPQYNAPSIVGELDAIVDLEVAAKLLDFLDGSVWPRVVRGDKPDEKKQIPWTMSYLYRFVEKLRTTDLSGYLDFINGLSSILNAETMLLDLAAQPVSKAPSQKKRLTRKI